MYSEIFKNLTELAVVETEYDIVSIIITYDSSRAITVQKEDDTHYCVNQFDLDTNAKCFTEYFRGNYIKMSEVE